MSQTDTDTSWYPEPDQEQIDKQAEEQRKLVASIPVIQDVLDWFDAQIAVYSNPTTISGVGVNTDAEEIKQAVLFAQTLIRDYERQRDNLRATFPQHITEVAHEA